MKYKIGFCSLIIFVSAISCIAEEIDDQKAMQLIYGNYDVTKKYSEWNKLTVRVLASDHSEDKYILLTEAAAPDCNSHPCSAEISTASFSKSGDNWKLDSQPRFVAKLGTFGRAPAAEIVKIGPNKNGFLFHPGSTGQGITIESLVLYSANGVEPLVSVKETSGDNKGSCDETLHNCWSYKSDIQFIAGKNPDYYDLVVTTSGNRPTRNRMVTQFKKVRKFTAGRGKYEPSPEGS